MRYHRLRSAICLFCLGSLVDLSIARSQQSSNVRRRTEQSLYSFSFRGGSSPWSSSTTPFTARRVTTQKSPQQSSLRTLSATSSQNRDAQDEREQTKEVMEAFLTRDSRNSFIARVYAILAGQLVVTALSVVMFGVNPGLGNWMRRPGIGSTMPVLSLLLSTVAWFVMCASASARRSSPLKWQILALFTAGEALSVGFISSFYHFRSVCSAMLATAVAATSVSLYTAKQRNPKYDLSQWGAGLSSCGLIFLVYGSIQLLQVLGVLPAGFMPYNEVLYSLAGACLFSFYLAYHTKLIVAGKHTKYQMSEKDYVFGAMTLYNDIINIFIYTLRLIGEDRDR
jgi:FtsH-binding integral membrane protein